MSSKTPEVFPTLFGDKTDPVLRSISSTLMRRGVDHAWIEGYADFELDYRVSGLSSEVKVTIADRTFSAGDISALVRPSFGRKRFDSRDEKFVSNESFAAAISLFEEVPNVIGRPLSTCYSAARILSLCHPVRTPLEGASSEWEELAAMASAAGAREIHVEDLASYRREVVPLDGRPTSPGPWRAIFAAGTMYSVAVVLDDWALCLADELGVGEASVTELAKTASRGLRRVGVRFCVLIFGGTPEEPVLAQVITSPEPQMFGSKWTEVNDRLIEALLLETRNLS